MTFLTSSPHPSIKLLPEFVIDQIKAGEIVERPSNLIKEVVENSLDAQSTKIDIHLVENGLKQITIRDNGLGIPFKDLGYAFCRHTTSKIENFQDLYKLRSFGFRGEALASIASIAHITCTSRRQQEEGGQISLSGKEQSGESIPQKGLPQGTLMVIKDLFFNTPVRLNFIKSQTSEKNAIIKILNSFLIAHPSVEFHIKWDREEKKIFRPSKPFERFSQTLSGGRWKEKECHFIEKQYEDYTLRGFYQKSSKKSGQGKNQYLFVNKRPIQDYVLHRVVLSALEPLWHQGTSGAYLLELTLPSHRVDVNVHPHKTVVKFAAPSVVNSLFHSALRKSTEKTEHNPSLFSPSPTPPSPQPPPKVGPTPHPAAPPSSSPLTPLPPSPPLYPLSPPSPPPPTFDLKKPLPTLKEKLPPTSIAIGPRYKVLSREGNFPLIVDCYQLLHFHLDSLKTQFFAEESSPLMIGIPFRDKKTVSQLKKNPLNGFDFDFLEESLAILKAVPSSLNFLPLKATVFHFLKDEKQFQREMEKNQLSSSILSNIVDKYSFETLTSKKILTLLNPDFLTKALQ